MGKSLGFPKFWNMEESLSIKEMCDMISIEEMAIKYGFVRNNSKSYRGGTVYDHDNGLRICISQSRKNAGQQHYSNLHDDSDGGSLYAFVKNRIKDGTITPPLRTYKENEAIASVLKAYLNMPIEDKEAFQQKIPVKKPDEPFFVPDGILFMKWAVNTTLLSQIRKFSKETYEHPLFKGTYYNCNKEVDSRRRGSDLAFPCYKADGTLGGVNIRYFNQHRNKCASMFMANSEHEHSIWHSNIPDKIDKVFIGESEFDCMAHFELTQNPNTLYISHQGNLMPGQVDAIMTLLKENISKFTPDFKMLLGADNDSRGSHYDLMLICGAAATKDKSNAKCFINEIPAKQEGYKAHIITVRPDLYDGFKEICLNSPKSENMRIDTDDENKSVIVSRPRDDKFADDALTSMVINSELVKNVVKAKAMTKDWNDDLKLLKSINSKIDGMKLGKVMSYDLFREKFDELSLQTKAVGHIADVVVMIQNQLTDKKKTDPDVEEGSDEEKSRRMRL